MAKHSQSNTAKPLEEDEQLEPRSHPVQQRSRQTVNRILETAAELIDEVGVVDFTTNLLAERADIRIRTIYRYFAGKTSDGVEYKETHRWAHTWIKGDSEWKILTGMTYPIG